MNKALHISSTYTAKAQAMATKKSRSETDNASPAARLLARVKRNPVIATIHLVSPVLWGGFGAAKEIFDFYQKINARPAIQTLAKELAGDAPETRIAAIQRLATLKYTQDEDVNIALRALESMISRRASAKAPGDPGLKASSDISLALIAAGNIVKSNASRKPKPLTIRKVHLARMDLSGAYLRGITLSDVNLVESTLSNADLSQSTLSDVQMARSIAYNTVFEKANIQFTCLEAAILSKANFASAEVSNSDFNAADMTAALVAHAKIENSSFRNTKLDQADLSSADFHSAKELTSAQLATTTGAMKSPPSIAGSRSFNSPVCH